MSDSRSSSEEKEEKEEAVLGRVTDPAALDRVRERRAELRITVPVDWSGRRVRIRLPKALRCHGCEGGGCDECSRSGAFRVPTGEGHQHLEITLPRLEEMIRRVVRIPHPFAEMSPIELLYVYIENDEDAELDPRVELLEAGLAVPAEVAPPRGWAWVGAAAAVALVAALARWLAG